MVRALREDIARLRYRSPTLIRKVEDVPFLSDQQEMEG